MLVSARGHLTSVTDVASADRSHLGRLHGDDGGRLAVERGELDFERPPVLVDVNDGADVSRLQAFRRHGLSQDDTVELFDHRRCSPLTRIGRDQSRRILPAVDEPDRSNHTAWPLSSVQREQSIDNIFFAVNRVEVVHDLIGRGDGAQRLHEGFDGDQGVAQLDEERGLPAVIGVCRIEQIVGDLAPVDDREVGVSELHNPRAFCHGWSARRTVPKVRTVRVHRQADDLLAEYLLEQPNVKACHLAAAAHRC